MLFCQLQADFPVSFREERRPGCSKHLPFHNYGGHCAFRNFQCSRIYFCSLPPDVCLNIIMSLSSTGSSFDFMTHSFALFGVKSHETFIQTGLCLSKSCPIGFTKDDQAKWEEPQLNYKCHNKGSEYLCQFDIILFSEK